MNIVIIANALHTNTLTGGDTIFVECAKRWIAHGHTVKIVTTEAGLAYCTERGVPATSMLLWPMASADRLGFVPAIFIKTFWSLYWSFIVRIEDTDVVFASSFFGPDIIPGLAIKMRHPAVRLVTSFYLFTRKQFGSDYSGGKMKGLLFFLNEQVSLLIIKHFGSRILTASEFDREDFAKRKHYPIDRIVAVGGGVDSVFFHPDLSQKTVHDAVFVGRFQPQKCIDELLQIWQMVVSRDKTRTLAIIGSGPLESILRRSCRDLAIEKNVQFLGQLDGAKKREVYAQSKIFVSASRFDSGNVALDEALACGLPGIIYDVPSFRYGPGVITIPIGNQQSFAAEIENVLTHPPLYSSLSKKAREYAETIDWDIQASSLIHALE